MSDNTVTAKVGCAGRYTITSNLRGKLAEFDNLITNWGLDFIGNNSGYMKYGHVGTGTSTPVVTGQLLGEYKTSVLANVTYTSGVLSTSPYYGWIRHVYRFTNAAGNITEVGVGPTTGNTSLFSHALILDANGLPTTITILQGEVLDVTYELRNYPPLNDFTGTINLVGNEPGTYAWKARAVRVGQIAWAPYEHGFTYSYYNIHKTSAAMVGLMGTPGSLTSSESHYNASYQSGSNYNHYYGNWGLTKGGTCKTVYVDAGYSLYFGVEFDPAIPKTSYHTMGITVKVAWGRYEGA